MQTISDKLLLTISTIIAVLLSLSPISILIEHHDWIDVFDKIFLTSTAFLITFFNLFFQRRLQFELFPQFKLICYAILFNIILLGINLLIRIPFWYEIQFHKPPLFVFITVDLVRSIIIALISYWIISLLNKNISRIALKIKLNELESQTLQLQLKNLTAQLQPHFFFNSLNVLSELINIDLQKSDTYIKHLSNIFRYVLTNQDAPLIQLNEEINFIKSYLFLLRIRFENSISVNYNLRNIENYTIPSLCTLMVLENIVKHNNIENIKIEISIEEEHQEIIINNTKNKIIRNKKESMGLGLTNIDKKCRLLLQRGIIVNEMNDIFEVRIPLNKIIENEN